MPTAPTLSEHNLARRVKYEREQRGWSQGALARQMTDAGVKMYQQTIARIENIGPKRRPVTVDEAVTFAYVFGTGLIDLAAPVDKMARDKMIASTQRVIAEAERHRDEAVRHLRAIQNADEQ